MLAQATIATLNKLVTITRNVNAEFAHGNVFVAELLVKLIWKLHIKDTENHLGKEIGN